MANVTIFEFAVSPNAAGDVSWPCETVTTIDTASVTSHSLDASTRCVIVAADADGVRMRINPNGVSTAAVGSCVPILSTIPNQFLIANASGQTLKFA